MLLLTLGLTKIDMKHRWFPDQTMIYRWCVFYIDVRLYWSAKTFWLEKNRPKTNHGRYPKMGGVFTSFFHSFPPNKWGEVMESRRNFRLRCQRPRSRYTLKVAFGHPAEVAVLDGGLPRWKELGRDWVWEFGLRVV